MEAEVGQSVPEPGCSRSRLDRAFRCQFQVLDSHSGPRLGLVDSLSVDLDREGLDHHLFPVLDFGAKTCHPVRVIGGHVVFLFWIPAEVE